MEADHILHWIVAYSAVHKLGAVAVPAQQPPLAARGARHPRARRGDRRGGQRHLRGSLGPLLGAVPSLPLVATVGGPGYRRGRRPRGRAGRRRRRRSRPRWTATTWPTSCTPRAPPGRPKGVAVRHGQVARVPNQLPEWQGTGWLTASPVFTFAGLGFIHNPMKAGMTVLHLPDLRRRPLARDRGAASGPTSAFVVPAMAQLLIHHPALRRGRPDQPPHAGAGQRPAGPPHPRGPCRPSCPGADVLNSYGMTEGGHATFAMDPEAARTRPGAVGRPTPPVEVRIVDEAGRRLSHRGGGRGPDPQPGTATASTTGTPRPPPGSGRADGCTPATSATSTPTATSTSWAARRR